MSKIYLLKYNNNYNRLLKSEATIAAYKTAVGVGNWVSFSGINFDKKDGIDTTQTINFTARTDFEGNYCVVTDENDNIISRWFILENLWNRQSQLILTLKRDVKIDFYDEYKAAPFYCEKGYVSGTSDPLVYCSEGQSFNHVLKSRTLLPKASALTTRTIVGFVDKTWKGGKVYEGLTYETWEDFPLYKYRNQIIMQSPKYGLYSIIYKDNPLNPETGLEYYQILTLEDGTVGVQRVALDYARARRFCNNTIDNELAAEMGEDIFLPAARKFIAQIKADVNIADSNEILKNFTNGMQFYIGSTGYTLNISIEPQNNTISANVGDFYSDELQDTFTQYGEGNWINEDTHYAEPRPCAYGKEVTISWTESGSPLTTIDLTGERNHTGQPYDIFYITDSSEAREFCSYFAAQYAGGHVLYDLQLVPYSPTGGTTATRVQIATNQYLYWATSDSDKGTLWHPAIATYSTTEDKKVGSNCDLCRIVSPDSSSYWEFNPAQIGGVPANSIQYEITFIPFATYIHIFPTFGGIYGNVNITYTAPYAGESRGLVCVDDFSLPYSTSNWETYKTQNAAYRDAHERIMQNMSVTQNAERVQEIAGAIANTASMAMLGAQAGGVPGAAVGGVGSAASGVASYVMNEKLRAEERSFAEDMFNYSLRNLQAQAQPLAKSNSVAVGNSYFPYIEFYSATEEEKMIFKNRIAQNGWSLGIVTDFQTMRQRASGTTYTKFIKGRMLRLNLNDDAHICAAINEELMKGVYIQ